MELGRRCLALGSNNHTGNSLWTVNLSRTATRLSCSAGMIFRFLGALQVHGAWKALLGLGQRQSYRKQPVDSQFELNSDPGYDSGSLASLSLGQPAACQSDDVQPPAPASSSTHMPASQLLNFAGAVCTCWIPFKDICMICLHTLLVRIKAVARQNALIECAVCLGYLPSLQLNFLMCIKIVNRKGSRTPSRGLQRI